MMEERRSLRPLVMEFAAGTVKHFGLQMYSTAVPAVAEMVSNAWDADAHSVWIEIPFGVPITPDLTFTVRDDGSGMTYDECLDKYLVVGRDRREDEGKDVTAEGRPVMGHKGLGKFAPFGIADIVEVRTVRNGRVTHFAMDYRAMVPPKGAPAEEFVKQYKPLPIQRDEPTSDPNGTTIAMKQLRLKRAISEGRFREGMARRFTCIAEDYFNVYINGTLLPAFSVSLDYRIPETGFIQEELPDVGGSIRWWAGFSPQPLSNDELRGISVVARGKVAQTPFFFHISKGVTGQAGMQYLVGVVEADFLDETVDLISTDRSSVLWEHPVAEPLLTWGQGKLPRWLADWARRRAKIRLERLRSDRPIVAEILDSISNYPTREREQLELLVNRLAAMVEDDRELEWAVSSVEGAYQDRRFMQIVGRLAEMEDTTLAEITSFMHEYEVLESIRLAQVVVARLEVIKTFHDLIAQEAREKPEMQDFVKKYPWILDPAWQVLRHEAAIDTIVVDFMKIEPDNDVRGRKRLDFFCLADASRVIVVELKRPGIVATLGEWQRFETYVLNLQRYYDRLTNPSDRKRVEGLFVATEVEELARAVVERADPRVLRRTDWDSLLRGAEQLHRDYLDALTAGSTPADPRLKNIRLIAVGDSLSTDPLPTTL